MDSSNNQSDRFLPDQYVFEAQNILPAVRTPSFYALGEMEEPPAKLEAKTSQYDLKELRDYNAGFQPSYHYVVKEELKAQPVKNSDKAILSKAELLKYLDELDTGYYTVQITNGHLEFESSVSDVTSSASAYSTSGDTRTPLEDGTSEDSTTHRQPANHVNTVRSFGSEVRTALDEESSKDVATAQQPTDRVNTARGIGSQVRTALDEESSKDVATAQQPTAGVNTVRGIGSEIRTALDEESSKDVATAQQPTDLETDHAYILPSGLILVNLAQLSTPQDSELVTGLERTPVNSETNLQAEGVDAGQNFVVFDLNTARELSQTEVHAVESTLQSAFAPVDVNLMGSDVRTAINESTDNVNTATELSNRDQI